MTKSARIAYGTLGLAAVFAAGAARAEPTADAPKSKTPPLPTVVRFDPAAMPEVAAPTSPLGLRYSSLSDRETNVLRRGFKLPLDALSAARSTDDLLGAVNVAPLPDPNQPLLSVAGAEQDGKADPFGPSRKTSFRDDPMRALGEMLAAVDGIDPAAAAEAPVDDPFAGDAAFSPAVESDTGVAAEVETTETEADPFATGADPFGGDEDPFGDF